MAQNLAIKQFVYKYASEDDRQPDGFTPFEDICQNYLNGKHIVSLGVQAPPGTEMVINNEDVIVGPSGVFELNNVIKIYSFKLKNNIYLRKVIIDVLYDNREESN